MLEGVGRGVWKRHNLKREEASPLTRKQAINFKGERNNWIMCAMAFFISTGNWEIGVGCFLPSEEAAYAIMTGGLLRWGAGTHGSCLKRDKNLGHENKTWKPWGYHPQMRVAFPT